MYQLIEEFNKDRMNDTALTYFDIKIKYNDGKYKLAHCNLVKLKEKSSNRDFRAPKQYVEGEIFQHLDLA